MRVEGAAEGDDKVAALEQEPHLVAQAARPVPLPPREHPLLEGLQGLEALTPLGEETPEFDRQSPVQSLILEESDLVGRDGVQSELGDPIKNARDTLPLTRAPLVPTQPCLCLGCVAVLLNTASDDR
jgi:hypothetical protein